MVNGGGPISIQRPQDIREHHKSWGAQGHCASPALLEVDTWKDERNVGTFTSFASDVVVKKKRQCHLRATPSDPRSKF